MSLISSMHQTLPRTSVLISYRPLDNLGPVLESPHMRSRPTPRSHTKSPTPDVGSSVRSGKRSAVAGGALESPTLTIVAGTPTTPCHDMAAFLTPLDAITNGPNIPVLRYLLMCVQRQRGTFVRADRKAIAQAVQVSTRHVSRALAALIANGFIERVPHDSGGHTYVVRCVQLRP